MGVGERGILSHTAKSWIRPRGTQLGEAYHAGDQDVSVAWAALVVVTLDPRRSSIDRCQLIQIPLKRHTREALDVTNQMPVFGVKCFERPGPDDIVIQALRGDPPIE